MEAIAISIWDIMDEQGNWNSGAYTDHTGNNSVNRNGYDGNSRLSDETSVNGYGSIYGCSADSRNASDKKFNRAGNELAHSGDVGFYGKSVKTNKDMNRVNNGCCDAGGRYEERFSDDCRKNDPMVGENHDRGMVYSEKVVPIFKSMDPVKKTWEENSDSGRNSAGANHANDAVYMGNDRLCDGEWCFVKPVDHDSMNHGNQNFQNTIDHDSMNHGNRGYVNRSGQSFVNSDDNAFVKPVDHRIAARSETKPAEPLMKYSDIKAISDYFIARGKYRDNALFITGICTGFRVSDLVRLKLKDVMDPDTHVFRENIDIYEQKTGKRSISKFDAVVITEAIKDAVSLYMSHDGMFLSGDDYLFKSRQKNSDGEYRMDESQGYRILVGAAKECGLPYHVGSHTMRKTFLNIANTMGSTGSFAGNTMAMTDCQILARHASLNTTMGYMNVTKSRLLSLRQAVSDFVMGRTVIKDLEVRYQYELEE